MASPVDASRVGTNITTAATSHNINVGSPSSGELLVVYARQTVTGVGFPTMTGYTRIGDTSLSLDVDAQFVFYRLADGTEGATDVMSSGSTKIAAICWRITGAADPATQAPEILGTNFVGTGANACDPSSASPTGGSKDYLFLACMGLDGEGNAPTASPSGYSTVTTANTGTAGAVATNCSVGGASKQVTAASENAGAFTHPTANSGGVGFVIAIHPAAVAAPGPASSRRPRRAHRYLTLR